MLCRRQGDANTDLNEEIVRKRLEPDGLDGGGLGLRRRREEVFDDLDVPESLQHRRVRDLGSNHFKVQLQTLSVGLRRNHSF